MGWYGGVQMEVVTHWLPCLTREYGTEGAKTLLSDNMTQMAAASDDPKPLLPYQI